MHFRFFSAAVAAVLISASGAAAASDWMGALGLSPYVGVALTQARMDRDDIEKVRPFGGTGRLGVEFGDRVGLEARWSRTGRERTDISGGGGDVDVKLTDSTSALVRLSLTTSDIRPYLLGGWTWARAKSSDDSVGSVRLDGASWGLGLELMAMQWNVGLYGEWLKAVNDGGDGELTTISTGAIYRW